MSDFRIDQHGSIVLLWPENERARAWLDETAPEEAQFWCDALVIEPRYCSGVISAAEDDGLTVAFS